MIVAPHMWELYLCTETCQGMGSVALTPPTISAGKNLEGAGLGKSEIAEKEYTISKNETKNSRLEFYEVRVVQNPSFV